MTQTKVADEFRTRRFVDVGDARVCYRKTGAGSALVLLHGFPLSGLTWRKMVPALSRHFTCYALDLVGLGDSSSRDKADFSSPGQGKVMRQALRAEGVESYALIGNDTGGWVARELALLDAGRVTHLALTNTEIPDHRPPWIRMYQAQARVPGSAVLMRRLVASRRFLRSPLGFGGCFRDLDLIEGEFSREFISPIVSSADRMSRMLRFLIEMRFRRIDQFATLHGRLSMPAAFLWGDQDPTFPEQQARAMAAQFPNVAGFSTIPGAKLFIQEEFPDTVAEWLIDFVSGGG